MNTLRSLRIASNVFAENASIPSLYKPSWVEPRLDYRRETRIDGALRHDESWAMSRSFSWATRAVTIPAGVVLSTAGWLVRNTLATALGVVGAAIAGAKTAVKGSRPGERACHRGFVKGYAVGAVAVGLASAPVLVVAGAAGMVGAVGGTLPVRGAGALIDRRQKPAAAPLSWAHSSEWRVAL